jgi:hypothetical protein
MKKTIILSLLLLTSICVSAQQPKFDPAKFDADLEQFITTEACLSPQQASAFFPVYREMLRKERVLFDQMRRYRHRDTSDDAACRDAIEQQDKLDIQIKEIQQEYHNKFMKILPEGKVFKILRAEEKFHRQAFRRMARPQFRP